MQISPRRQSSPAYKNDLRQSDGQHVKGPVLAQHVPSGIIIHRLTLAELQAPPLKYLLAGTSIYSMYCTYDTDM